MERWIQCGDAFLEADVVKWTEAIWEERGSKGKVTKIGEREVVAEVLDDDGSWLRLLVRGSTLLSDKPHGRRAHALKPGEEIRRKRKTLERGSTARLPWSDESVRASLESERAARRSPAGTPEACGIPVKPSDAKARKGKRRKPARA